MEQNQTSWAQRWLALYLALWFLPSPLGELPWVGAVFGFFPRLKERGAQWLSGLLLGQPVRADFSSGSDRTVDYFITLLLSLLAALLAAVLSLRRVDARWDARLLACTRAYLRLDLAVTMVLYGLAKVFPLQFVMPGPRIMTMPVGDLTPEELMWAFMGASQPYVLFAGVAELVGGTLLLWRRTTPLGALILFAVMGNVALMDLCYDVNMKLAALHLLLAITFVLAPALPRILRALMPDDHERERGPIWLASLALFALIAYQYTASSWRAAESVWARHPLGGYWAVVDATGSGALHMVTIQLGGVVLIGRDHARRLYRLDGSSADALSLLDLAGKPAGTLHAQREPDGLLTLHGELAGEGVQLVLRRAAEPRLGSHHFSWTRDQEATHR